MIDLKKLKETALLVVEEDMARYKDAIDKIDEWTKKECSCAIVLDRFCTRCVSIHHYGDIMQGIQNKYWHSSMSL